MGIRNTTQEGVAALFDSSTGRAFGPVFDSETELDDFLEWYGIDRHVSDLRHFTFDKLVALVQEWEDEKATLAEIRGQQADADAEITLEDRVRDEEAQVRGEIDYARIVRDIDATEQIAQRQIGN